MVNVRDRPHLQSVDTFDFVVLVGDKNEVKKSLEDLPKSCCTWILLEALTTVSSHNFKNDTFLIKIKK